MQRMFGSAVCYVDCMPGIERAVRPAGCDDAEDGARRVINCESLSKHVCRNGSMQPRRQSPEADSSDLEGWRMGHRRRTALLRLAVCSDDHETLF